VVVPDEWVSVVLAAFTDGGALLALDPYRDLRVDPREIPRALAALDAALAARRRELEAGLRGPAAGRPLPEWRARWLADRLASDPGARLLTELRALLELGGDGAGEVWVLGD
jgi:hypothetical protein